MENGTVKWFNRRRGWGFIKREGKPDLFVHQFDVEGTISDGDKVEFEVESGVKPKAIHVKNLSPKQVKTEEPSSLIGTQPQAKFCGECGASLVSRFCKQCGTDSENIVKAKLPDEKKKEDKLLDDRYRKHKLNEEQKKAAEYTYDKPLLVTAGPGTGKTTVAAERVKELLRQGLGDKEILCVTFTKSAQQTMQDRLSTKKDESMTNHNMKNQIRTFHSLCYNLLGLVKNQTFQVQDQDRDNDNPTELTDEGELWKKKFKEKFKKYTEEEWKDYGQQWKDEFEKECNPIIDENTQVKKDLEIVRSKQGDEKFKSKEWLQLEDEKKKLEERNQKLEREIKNLGHFDDYKFKRMDPTATDTFLDLVKAVSAFKIERRNVEELEKYLKNKSVEDDPYLQKLEDLKKYFIAYNKFLKTLAWDRKIVWFDKKGKKKVGRFVEFEQSSKNNVIRNIKDFNDYLLDIINGVKGRCKDWCSEIHETNKPYYRFLNWNHATLKHIIIDEFQDNNYLQFELAKMLAIEKAENNITVVGDINQSIYTFQGANPEIFNEFKNKYAEADEITLKLNYRSTQKIVELSNRLLKRGKYLYEPEPTESKTEHEQGKKIQVYEFSKVEDEYNFFVETIIDEIGKKFKRRNGKIEEKTFGDFIILTRTNEIRKQIKTALVDRFIPTRTKKYHALEYGGKMNPGKYTTFLKQFIGQYSELDLQNVPKPTLKKFIEKLALVESTKCEGKYSEYKDVANALLYKVLLNLANCFMKKYGADPLHPLTLQQFYDYITKFEDRRAIGELEDKVCPNCDYINSPKSKFCDKCGNFLKGKGKGQPRDNIGDAVEIKTVHSVKGEEFPFVIISSSYEGHFPLAYRERELKVPPEYLRYRRKHCMLCNSKLTLGKEKISCTNKECKANAGIEEELHKMEERRLYYVAMTRAMNELIITVPKKIVTDGKTYDKQTSQFLMDLNYQYDPENIEWHDMSEDAELSQGEMDSMHRQHKQQWENDFKEMYDKTVVENERRAKTKADTVRDYEKEKLEQRIQELSDEKRRHDEFDKKETSWEILEVAPDESLDKTEIAYQRLKKFWMYIMNLATSTPERKKHAEEQYKRITQAYDNIVNGIGDTKI